MKSKCVILLLSILPLAPIRSVGRAVKQDAPILTLADAVSIALGNNRLVKNAALEAKNLIFR